MRCGFQVQPMWWKKSAVARRMNVQPLYNNQTIVSYSYQHQTCNRERLVRVCSIHWNRERREMLLLLVFYRDWYWRRSCRTSNCLLSFLHTLCYAEQYILNINLLSLGSVPCESDRGSKYGDLPRPDRYGTRQGDSQATHVVRVWGGLAEGQC